MTTTETHSENDPLYEAAVLFVTRSRRASISAVQREFKIGYNRAALIVEEMEARGIVTPLANNGTRCVLTPPLFDD